MRKLALQILWLTAGCKSSFGEGGVVTGTRCLNLHPFYQYRHSHIKYGGSPTKSQNGSQEVEEEVIVAGDVPPKVHCREAGSAETEFCWCWGWGSSVETVESHGKLRFGLDSE